MTEHDWLTSTDPQGMLEWMRQEMSGDGYYPSTCPLPLKASDRKLRLFACACVRQVWDGVVCERCEGKGEIPASAESFSRHLKRECPDCSGGRVAGLIDPRSRHAVEVAEMYADGEVTKSDALNAAVDSNRGRGEGGFDEAARWTCREVEQAVSLVPTQCRISEAAQVALLRDIFGNPFRPFSKCLACADPEESYHSPECEYTKLKSWLTSNVVDLAQTIYRERRFADMPILGDALEEAGCDSKDVLMHCRGWERCPDCIKDGKGNSPGDHERKFCSRCNRKNWLSLRGHHVRGCWVLDLVLGKE